MKEQSHKDEMSAALRGDFERLRGRGVAVALAPGEPAREVQPEPAVEAEESPESRGWLARVLGRSSAA